MRFVVYEDCCNPVFLCGDTYVGDGTTDYRTYLLPFGGDTPRGPRNHNLGLLKSQCLENGELQHLHVN